MTSQPTAMRPFMLSSTPCDSSALSSTTVLAQDSDRPKRGDAPHSQPHHQLTAMPSTVAMVILAPRRRYGNALDRQAGRGWKNAGRHPNISSMTPISESCAAIPTSATKPGVAGPIRHAGDQASRPAPAVQALGGDQAQHQRNAEAGGEVVIREML